MAGAGTQLDANYHAARTTLTGQVKAAAGLAWTRRTFGDDDSYLRPTLILVQAGMLKMSTLVSGYFSLKSRVADGVHSRLKAVDPNEYTIEKLRGVPADQVYGRPFGTVAALMAGGSEFFEADQAALAYVRSLVGTDLQLAQTHAAKAWIEAHGG